VGDFGLRRANSLEKSRGNADCTRLEFCHDICMAKIKRLLDIYRFPGFVPFSSLRGVFGDHRAVVMRLRRRQKKRCAEFVGKSSFTTTTNGLGKCVTCPAEIDGFTWPTMDDVSIARGARL
jgi:hypothetical protein